MEQVIPIEFSVNDTVGDDVLEIRYAGGMCLVSGVGDPRGYKLEKARETRPRH